MFSLLFLCMGALIRLFRNRGNLVLENLVLRQQLAVLKRRHPRPSLGFFDKLFWVVVRRCWSEWKQALIVVTRPVRTFSCGPLKHADLVPQSRVLELKGSTRTEDRRQSCEECRERNDHRREL
jgi:hypothetical protein